MTKVSGTGQRASRETRFGRVAIALTMGGRRGGLGMGRAGNGTGVASATQQLVLINGRAIDGSVLTWRLITGEGTEIPLLIVRCE